MYTYNTLHRRTPYSGLRGLTDELFLRSSLQGEDADLLVELGYQLSLSGTFDSAMEAYQAGARANEGDVRAMTGVVYCQVRYGEGTTNLRRRAPFPTKPAVLVLKVLANGHSRLRFLGSTAHQCKLCRRSGMLRNRLFGVHHRAGEKNRLCKYAKHARRRTWWHTEPTENAEYRGFGATNIEVFPA